MPNPNRVPSKFLRSLNAFMSRCFSLQEDLTSLRREVEELKAAKAAAAAEATDAMSAAAASAASAGQISQVSRLTVIILDRSRSAPV